MIRITFKNHLPYIVMISFYRLSLDWIFQTFMVPLFFYNGFVWNASPFLTGISWVLLLAFAEWMWPLYLNRDAKISYEILLILYLLSFVPFTTMVRAGMFTTSFWLSNSLYWLFLLLFCTRKWKLRTFKIAAYKRPKNAPLLIAVALFLSVIYISGKYAGFRLNFDLSKVYDLRAEANEYALPSLLSYAFSWSRMANAILVSYFIRSRRYKWALFCVIVQLFNFGIDGTKMTFFLLLFSLIINALPAFEWRKFNQIILCGLIALDLFSALWILLRQDEIFLSLFARRMRFFPLRITRDYFDFFTTHEPDFFRQSLLRHFGFQSPYPKIAYMIAWIYTGKVSYENSGLISDAVANFGWAGIALSPLLIALVLRVLDKCAKDLDIRIVISVALYAAVSLSNTFFFTVLLSHGLLLVMYLLHRIERNSLTTQQLSLSELETLQPSRSKWKKQCYHLKIIN